MHISVILKILGTLLMLFSLTLLPPIFISVLYHDNNHLAFLWAFTITFITGLIFWLPVYNTQQDLRTRDGFLVTALFWSVLSLFGCLPFMFSEGLHLSFIDALFESFSGLTTSGGTVISGLDFLPKSLLYYRQQMQWLGGIGIVVIAVAILPMLGIGGMQLYRAEAPGPVKDSKLTPRITETAKALFFIYMVLTVACTLCYKIAGMDWFDAVAHAFSTVANGGFSPYDNSIRHFDNSAILFICSIFMLIAGANFTLHFLAWQEKSLRHYLRDAEFVFYLRWLTIGATTTVLYLYFSGVYGLHDSFFIGFFNFSSTVSTAGFATDFVAWPSFLPYMIFLFAFMGGCASSTGGGIKMIRVLLLFKQGARETQRLIHPNATILIKLGNRTVPGRVIEAVWGFFAMYVVMFIIMFLMLLATGLDLPTSFSAVGACITNLGPGMGDVAVNYSGINDPAKLILCFAMLLGRLEVFTLLVLFSPMFWRH